MKSLKIFMILIGIIVSLSSASACGNSLKCDMLQVEWNSSTRKFTIKMKNLERVPISEIIWSNNNEIIEFLDLVRPGISGDSIISSILPEKYGDPLQGGNDGNGVLYLGEGSKCGLTCTFSFKPTNNLLLKVTHIITISPNPATPSETITIKGEYASDAKVSITSVGGQTVGGVIPSVGTDAMTVSLSGLNLQAGIYFIRIESREKVFSGKLCVK
jgi:hypothetical protein